MLSLPKRQWMFGFSGLLGAFMLLGIPTATHSFFSAPHIAWRTNKKNSLSRTGQTISITTLHRYIPIRTTVKTVGDLLKELGVNTKKYAVSPNSLTPIRQGMNIKMLRLHKVIKTTLATIPYAVVTKSDGSLSVGQNRIAQVGRKGISSVATEYIYAGTHLVKQHVVRQKVVAKPVSEVVLRGTKNTVSRGGQVLRYSKVINVMATGYWADPSWSNGITATGVPARRGVVAVDPRVIPLGTRLYIPGYGVAIAADTGSAIIGAHIDLCFNHGTSAVDWGVHYLKVYILN